MLEPRLVMADHREPDGDVEAEPRVVSVDGEFVTFANDDGSEDVYRVADLRAVLEEAA